MDLRKLPNALTIGRGAAGPVGAFLLLASYSSTEESGAVGFGIAAFIVLIVAALSDAIDGWLARALNAETALGELLDPIADKILVGSYLVAFVVIFGFDLLLVIPVALILLRDLTVTGLRLSSAKPSAMRATTTAKLKTFFQMILVIAPFVVVMTGPHDKESMGRYALSWIVGVWFLAGVTLWSALPYWRARNVQ